MPLLTLTLSLPPGVTLSNPDAARIWSRLHDHALIYLYVTDRACLSAHLTEGDCTGSLTADFTQHAGEDRCSGCGCIRTDCDCSEVDGPNNS
jgi:hypothetical protein